VADRACGPSPLQIVDDEEVEETIPVIIEPTSGNGPGSTMDSGLFRYIFKASALDIAIEVTASRAGASTPKERSTYAARTPFSLKTARA